RIGSELAGDGEAQRVGASARNVPLIARDAIARTHHAALERAAGAVVVAHLDRTLETAAGAGITRPVEVRMNIVGAISGAVTKQTAVIEFRRLHDLTGIVKSAGIETRLDLFEGPCEPRPEHSLVEFRTHDAVAVLARV